MNILVIAEHDKIAIKEVTLSTITAARELGAITLLIVGSDCNAAASAGALIKGVKKVLHVDDVIYKHQIAETIATLVVSLASEYSHILASATASGRNFMPRVAALLDVAQISDVIKIESTDTFVRPIYAGNALATVQSSDAIKVLTVRATSFQAAGKSLLPAPIECLPSTDNFSKTIFIDEVLRVSERPELAAAKVVISGGRGMAKGENFTMLEEVADKLGAAIGASRAAVDAGFVANDMQIGQTGKIVAPELYIAVGISGAIQHLAGMKESKVIVAINNDEEAPIFQIADYGLVGDLFDAVPALVKELT